MANDVRQFLGVWALPVFIGLAVSCVVAAFIAGNERWGVEEFVTRFRRRGRYLRWLSMACLAAMGAMIASGVETVHVVATVGAAQVTSGTPETVASIAVAGLVAALLASVYRYIVRLAYFYDSRADALDLLGLKKKSPLDRDELDNLARLMRVLAPEGVHYPSASGALKALGKPLTKDTDK
ncbi:MAG TPA: hypothetical protein VIF57_29305 [Polyangia bacterium]